MLQSSLKKITALAIIAVLAITLGTTAFAFGTNNYTQTTAISLGRWSPTMNVPTTELPDGINEAYYSFTASAGDRFYIRMGSAESTASGMRLQLRSLTGALETDTGIVNRGGLLPFRFVSYVVPTGTPANTTFIIRIYRESSAVVGDRIFTPTFYNLFANGSDTFPFSGTATNTGNTGMDMVNGKNSTELTLNLTNNANIPVGAKVRSVTTRSTMTPSQGNVRHHIANAGVWHVSTVSSATSGSYNITIANDYNARAIWTFRYNVLALAPSTMSNVSITINYEYNVTSSFVAT